MNHIVRAGKSRPEWWNETPMKHPKTLDLRWRKYDGPWDPQTQPGHYLVSVVNRRPDLWKSTAKMIENVVRDRRTDREGRYDAAHWLAHIYARFLEDYARGAYWWLAIEKKGNRLHNGQILALAECYWKLGARSMAIRRLSQVNGGTVKLWSDMGDLRRALDAANQEARGTNRPEGAWMAAAAACRRHDDRPLALAYYDRVLKQNTEPDNEKLKTWAREAKQALEAWYNRTGNRLKDGNYTGSATGFRSAINVSVSIARGRMTAVEITEHQEDWFGRALTDTPNAIVANQGPVGVDAVTAATRTSDAIITATLNAVCKAR